MADGDLRKIFRKYLPRVHWISVESRLTDSGIPDLNGCLEGVEFWVECKATRGHAVVMRPAQVGWLARRHRAGGRVLVAVRRRARHADELWLVAGEAAAILRSGGLAALPRRAVLGCWDGGPARWPWTSVRTALVS